MTKREYLTILEPDDFIDSSMYEKLYKIAKENNSDIVKSNFYRHLYQDGYTVGKYLVSPDGMVPESENDTFTLKDYPIFMQNHPSIWSAIYKKEFINNHNIRFTEAKGAGWTDNLFQVQTFVLAKRINYTKWAYYYWRIHHIYDSDGLKDYKLPFLRCEEIDKWFEDNNINDENIFACFYRKKVAYAKIVLGMKHIEDEKDCYTRIKNMLSNVREDIMLNSSFITDSEKRACRCFKTHPEKYRNKLKIKYFLRHIIRIKINKKIKLISLFGKTLYSKEACQFS